jgi:hypothetical protein
MLDLPLMYLLRLGNNGLGISARRGRQARIWRRLRSLQVFQSPLGGQHKYLVFVSVEMAHVPIARNDV